MSSTPSPLNHHIEGNTYQVVDSRGVTLLKVTLLPDRVGDQVTVETPQSVFTGPIQFLKME